MFPDNTTKITRKIIDEYLKGDEVCVDMTLGNGRDAEYLLERIPEGFLYGFDIQKEALARSAERLERFENKKLIRASHDRIDEFTDGADLLIYNLGYLPGGDKSVVTEKETVWKSLEKGLSLLSRGGIVLMTFYPGHPSGKAEEEYLSKKLEDLDQKKYNIVRFSFPNQKHDPPFLVFIEKRDG